MIVLRPKEQTMVKQGFLIRQFLFKVYEYFFKMFLALESRGSNPINNIKHVLGPHSTVNCFPPSGLWFESQQSLIFSEEILKLSVFEETKFQLNWSLPSLSMFGHFPMHKFKIRTLFEVSE